MRVDQTPGGAADALSVVPLESKRLREEAAALYRSVFGYTDSASGLSPRLLRGLIVNGGSALGAVDANGRLIGFSYGFTGVENGVIYHYSQATAVLREAQGSGVGRLLKHAQAEVARATGATSMRWAFDPVNARNGHFNLDSLGARGRRFYPDFYDEPASDRMIADWDLGGTPAIAPATTAARALALEQIEEIAATTRSALTATGAAGGYRWLALPSTLPTPPDEALAVRDAVADACSAALDDGLAAVSCMRLPGRADTAAYLFGGDES
jgi:predicted GNAT superfamily acetyltransferase